MKMTEAKQYWIERAQKTIDSEVVQDAKVVAEIERIIALMYAEIAKNC